MTAMRRLLPRVLSIQRQVEEYVAWVNSHLKKRPGSPLIYDLRSLQDGVILVNLVEVLSEFNTAARSHSLRTHRIHAVVVAGLQ